MEKFTKLILERGPSQKSKGSTLSGWNEIPHTMQGVYMFLLCLSVCLSMRVSSNVLTPRPERSMMVIKRLGHPVEVCRSSKYDEDVEDLVGGAPYVKGLWPAPLRPPQGIKESACNV